MELDNNNNRNDVLNNSVASPSSSLSQQQQHASHTMIIRSFSAAISALKQHSFRNVTDFQVVSRKAADLYTRTHHVVNTTDISNLQAAHSTLHPDDHFLAYMSTLHASLAAVDRDSPVVPALLSSLADVVRRVDPRWARAIPERWIGAARHATRLAIDTPNRNRAIALIRTIHTAADKLLIPTSTSTSNENGANTSSTTSTATKTTSLPSTSSSSSSSSRQNETSDELVPLHADLLALCIHAKYYRYAARWIRLRRRLHVNPKSSRLTASDVHLIYHYSTWVLAGVKDFPAALQTCRLALVVPAPSAGTFFPVAVMTYKLYVLLHLLVAGTCPTPLRLTSYQVGPLRKLSSEYVELGVAFEANDLKRVLQIVESNRMTFTKHETLGLVKQVVQALYKRLVLRLSNCYVKMTLKQVADKIGLDSEEKAHQLLLQMIQAGELNAVIDMRQKVVRLMDQENDIDEQHLSNLVSHTYMTQCLDVLTRLQRFREDVECDPEYIKRDMAGQSSRKPSSSNARAFASGGGGLSLGVADIEAEFMR